MKVRPLIVIGALAVTPTAVGCLSTGVANAAGACGGNSTSHLAPIDCTNTLTVSGITGGAHLTVTTSGAVHVDAQVSNKTVPLYLQVKAHDGVSSNGGFVGQTAVFVNGVASVNVQMPGCLSQIDTKIVPGTPTLDHVSDIYRVAAPLVELPNCTATTTVPATTVPQSSTTVPATSVPSSTVPPQTSVPQPTTSAPTVPSVTSKVSGGTLPPTGGGSRALPLAMLGILVGFLFILTAAVRRRPS